MNNLIVKKYHLIHLILATALLGCSPQELPDPTATHSQPLTLQVSDSGFSNDNTRSVEKGYTTQFVSGDAIGIIAIKNGAVVNDINNIKATNNGSAWVAEAPIYAYADATYIAYTPYDANLSTSGIGSIDELIDMFEIQDNQSYREGYMKSDVMTGTGSIINNTELHFTLSHAFSMIEVTLPRITYKFNNATLADYHIPTAEFNSGTAGLTMYESSPNAWRRIIKPGATFTLSGSYTTSDGKIKDYKYTLPEGAIQRGECRHVQVDSDTIIYFNESTGDLMFTDGSLMSKNDAEKGLTEEQKKSCIGVIVYATDSSIKFGSAEQEELSNKSITPHGYVYALKKSTDENGKTTFMWFNGRESTATDDTHTYVTTIDQLYNDIDGLRHTQVMKEKYPDCAMVKAINRYSTLYPHTESLTTEWFLPSCGQWIAILSKLTTPDYAINDFTKSPYYFAYGYESNTTDIISTLNNELLKVGYGYVDQFGTYDYYWASSEYSSINAIEMYFTRGWKNGITTDVLWFGEKGKEQSIQARYILAF